MKQLLFILCLITTAISFAQTSDGVNKKVYSVVDQKPHTDYNTDVFTDVSINYPDSALKAHIEGTVLVQFVVNEDSSISDCKVLSGIGGGCDEEALRIIKGMPKWAPGKLNGKGVKAYDTLPVVFYMPKPTLGDVERANVEVNDDEISQVYYEQHPYVYEYVEQEPRAPYDVNEYLNQNIRNPKPPRYEKKTGDVIVKFVVNEDGSISDCEIEKGMGKGYNQEALRLVERMSRWIPGKQNGQFVKAYFRQTVSFK